MHSYWISVCACLNFRTSNQIEFENYKLERKTENKKEKGRAGLAWVVFISTQIRPFLFGFTWWAEFTHVDPLLPFSAVTDEWAPQPLPLARTSGRHRCCACVPSASHYCSHMRLDPLAGGARRPVAPAVVLQLTPMRGPACSALYPRGLAMSRSQRNEILAESFALAVTNRLKFAQIFAPPNTPWAALLVSIQTEPCLLVLDDH